MSKEYIEPKKRYEDEKSTGILFLILGGCGAIVSGLCAAGIIPFPFSTFQSAVLTVMFLVFMGIGIWSLKNASRIASTMDSENDYVETIRQWIADNRSIFTEESVSSEALSGPELYFERENAIRCRIQKHYPAISEELLDSLVESTYQELYEQ